MAGALAWGFVGTAYGQPGFSKVFTPDTIGPGSVSTLTFTIDNTAGALVTGLAFTDTLPFGVTIADPANASSDCLNGVLTAPDGGSTVSLTGDVGAGRTCTVSVDVTSSTPGIHMNVSGDLTSSAGNSGTAADDLTVSTALPGFSKSFSPSMVLLGGRSTLTFTIDNTLNASRVGNLDFTDNLPTGIVVANPANATTDCVSAGLPDTTITAVPGTDVITLAADGSTVVPGFEVLPAGATCTVSVDVTATGIGNLANVTEDLLADFVSAGKASDEIEATVDMLGLTKSFLDDPVPPGGSVTLEFTIRNLDRDFPATGITFSDDLDGNDGALADVAAAFGELPKVDVCGLGSLLSGSDSDRTITLTGGNLPDGGECTFSVLLDTPPTISVGAHFNQTSVVTATIDGSTEMGSAAQDLVFIEPAPILTKEFLDAVTLTPDPVVGAGDVVVIRFTITDTSTVGSTAITFIDELTTFLPLPLSVTFPPGPPCNPGSSIGFVFPDIDRQALSLTGGNLGAGQMCSFDVTVSIPAGLNGATITNTTGPISADVGGTVYVGKTASDDLTIVGAPAFTKEFTDDPKDAGETVTLEFTLANTDPDNAASGIAFMDVLTGALAGLTFDSLISNDCGGTLSGLGTGTIDFSGGALAADGSCTIRVAVMIPGAASPGVYTNTTTAITATVLGAAATGKAASGDLMVGGLNFSKEFIDDPVIPGGSARLRFTVANTTPATTFSGISFTDVLSSVLTGLTSPSPNLSPVPGCGAASSLTIAGGSSVFFSSGEVGPGATCTFDITVDVPGAAAEGTFPNITSSLTASIPPGTNLPAAVDSLTVDSNLLQLTKEFTDDPAIAGGTVTLEFTLTNLDPDDAASAVDFTDDLDAALSGLVATSEDFNDCGFTVGGLGTGMLSLTGGSVGAGASCTLRLTLTLPPTVSGNSFLNTTSSLTGTIAGLPVVGDPASDTLRVFALTFDKVFGGSLVAGGAQTLTFTIVNLDTTSGIGALSFLDDLGSVVPGLVAVAPLPTEPCGLGSSLSGTSVLTLTGGNLAASGTCSIPVTVTVPSDTPAGMYVNTTSDLLQSGLPLAGPASDTLTVVAEADISVTKDDGLTMAIPGETLTYAIVVNNDGPSDDPSASLTDTFPAGLTCTYTSVAAGGATGNTAAGSGDLAETLSMPAGSSVTYTVMCGISSTATGTLMNTAAVSGSVGDPDAGNDSDTDSNTLLVPMADVAVSKDDGVTSAVPGQSTLTYTIVASNAGPSAAPTVMLADNFPSDLSCTFTSAAAGGATGNTAAGSGDLAEMLDLPAGGSVTYTVTCSIDSSATGTLSNTASLTSSVADPDPGDNSATDSDTVLMPEADLVITKTDFADPATAGTNLTYTIRVDNNGPSDAQGVVVTDTLPAGVTLESTSGCAEDPGAVPTCTLGTIAAGSSTSYTIAVTVDSSTTGTLTNTASAASSTAEANPGDESTSEDTNVQTAADLVITKTDSADPATAGTNLTYTIRVDNNGPSDARDVIVVDMLPAGVALVSTSGCAEDPSGVSTCSLGTIPANGGGIYEIIVTVDDGFDGALTNNATVSSSTLEANPGDESVDEMTNIVSSADLRLAVVDSPDPVQNGSNVIYSHTITNDGPSAAAGVQLDVLWPGGVRLVSSNPPPGGTCTPGASGVDCDLGPLGPGHTVAVDIVLRVLNDARGQIVLDSTASSATDDPQPANNIVQVMTQVDSTLDIELFLFAPGVVPVNGDFELNATVLNKGPVTATGAELEIGIPDNLRLADVRSPDGVSCGTTPVLLKCNLPRIPNGVEVKIPIVVQITDFGRVPISGEVVGSNPDSDPANNSATAEVEARMAGDLNGDGVVDVEDIGVLIREINDDDGEDVDDVAGGSHLGNALYDVNRDGSIDAADLRALARIILRKEEE